MKKLIPLFIISLSFILPSIVKGQEVIEIEPLFEYPVAPESLENIHDKSNYLVEHFWDNFDFKNKNTVDQNALNDAFRVYAVPLRWADKQKAIFWTDKLLSKISKNPTLMLQFTKAAEEALYSPRADVWVDEIYVKFLAALDANTKIPEGRKTRYHKQFMALKDCQVGNFSPRFAFKGRNGKDENYIPMTTVSILIFGDPTLVDWRISRMKLETNMALRQAVDKGQIRIQFFVPKEMDNWESEVSNYPSTWVVGCAPGVEEKYDLRMTPSFYVIGSDGKIIKKNTTLDDAVYEALSQVNK